MRWLSLLVAAVLGFVVGRACARCPQAEEPVPVALLDALERQAIDDTCLAQRAFDVINERVRLTGSVNPEACVPCQQLQTPTPGP